MNAIKQIRKYLENHPHTDAAQTLGRLAAALAEEAEFPLAELYKLDYETFSLAIELLKDWRLDRYYAARIRLFDTVLSQLQEGGAAAEAHTAA